jgi:outer membrane protein assembly factor BamB
VVLPGVSRPVDSSFSTPVLETRDGKRVMYYTTGCGHIVCVNARNGKPYWKMPFCKNGVNPSVVLHKGTNSSPSTTTKTSTARKKAA